VLTEDTADMTMALILAVARRIGEGERLVRSGRWTGWAPTAMLGMRLAGKRLGIVGMGRIGLAVAKRARAFGMSIHYHNRRRIDAAVGSEVEATYWESLDQMLGHIDVLSVNCPHTPATYHLLSARRLRLLKPRAIVVNTARGSVIEEEALARALYAREIAGAGLDVYEHESQVHPRKASSTATPRPTRSCIRFFERCCGCSVRRFVVAHIDAPARTGRDVVHVERAHVAAVEMQGHASGPTGGDTGHMDMVGVGHEARDCPRIEEHDPAAFERNTAIGADFAVRAHIGALFEEPVHDADHAPAAMVVHGRPLARQPHERVERQLVVRAQIDRVAPIVRGIRLAMFGPEKLGRKLRQTLHQRRDRIDAVGNVWKAVDFAFRTIDEFGQGRMHLRFQFSWPATI